jgi:hypothetical protein
MTTATQGKTEGQHMWDNASNPAEETAALRTLLKEQQEEIEALESALRIQGEEFGTFRALVCKAAWALRVTDVVGFTKKSTPTEELPGHNHELWTEEQQDALGALAALDTSGYAPPAKAGNLVEGTGTGEHDNPPRYEPRDSRTYNEPREGREVPS